jgi:O-antigen/teichoic acid export membrane protein
MPITLVSMAISQGTQPLFADLTAHPHHAGDASRVATSHVLLVLLAAAVVLLVGPAAVDLLLPASYGAAADYIPWLALGAGLFGLHLMPMNALSITSGRTGQAWAVTGVAAIVNVTLNLLLLPRFGPLAAAINTVVGYGILLVGMELLARRLSEHPLRYETRRLLAGGALIVAACIVGLLLAPVGSTTGLLLRAGIAAGLTVVLLTVGPLRREARAGLDLFTPPRASAT